MTQYILNKEDLSLIDELEDGVSINGLNPAYVIIKANNLIEAQANCRDQLIDSLQKEVEDWSYTVWDRSFREKAISWKYDPTSSETRKARIVDLENWSDSIWLEYYRIKAKYEISDFSESFDPSVITPRPWAFHEIASC